MPMKSTTIIVSIAAAAVVFLGACVPEGSGSSSQQGERAQERNMRRAVDIIPPPIIDNFNTRRAVDRWNEEMDEPDQVFYIYVLSPMGNPIGYFVGEHRPVNICVSQTPPMRLERADLGAHHGQILVPAPGLDGVYYSGANCESHYFWDEATGRYIEIGRLPFFISNAPLRLDVPRIEVIEE